MQSISCSVHGVHLYFSTEVAFQLSGLASRTSPQNWFWPEWSFSRIIAAQFSRSGRPERGILESCAGKCTRAPWTFPFKLARIGSFRTARPDKLKTTYIVTFTCMDKDTTCTVDTLRSFPSIFCGLHYNFLNLYIYMSNTV